MFEEIKEYKERGTVRWKVIWTGIRGGIIQLNIEKNRIRFDKNFNFNNEESFQTAIKICQNKAFRIIHMKNSNETNLGRLATYCLEATEVLPIEKGFEYV